MFHGLQPPLGREHPFDGIFIDSFSVVRGVCQYAGELFVGDGFTRTRFLFQVAKEREGRFYPVTRNVG